MLIDTNDKKRVRLAFKILILNYMYFNNHNHLIKSDLVNISTFGLCVMAMAMASGYG